MLLSKLSWGSTNLTHIRRGTITCGSDNKAGGILCTLVNKGLGKSTPAVKEVLLWVKCHQIALDVMEKPSVKGRGHWLCRRHCWLVLRICHDHPVHNGGRTLTSKNMACWEFPDGPVVRTLRFHCWGPRFDLWLGNYDPAPSPKKRWLAEASEVVSGFFLHWKFIWLHHRSYLWHTRSSSLTRARTLTLCIGSSES